MTEAERRKILFEWNQTAKDYPRDQCIHQLFEEQAERTPEAAAVVCGEKSLSYGELNRRSNQLAAHLRFLGVGRESIVGLCIERSLEMAVAVLAILKAGGAYWAVEEKLPEDRLLLLLGDARPRVLLVRKHSAGAWLELVKQQPAGPKDGCAVAILEDLLESFAGLMPAPVDPVQAEDPAYVSFTSGSTGRPKGVVVPHRGVVRLVKGADYVSLDARQAVLHLSPLSFDASTFELWGPLLNGGRVVLMPPGPLSCAEIGAAIRRHGVTTLWLTAGLFHLMVEEYLPDLKPLRQLLAGGDVLSPHHVRQARNALPGCRIVNGYGPTENTTFTCCHVIDEADDLERTVPIGRPVANTRVYVLDAQRQPVPAGVAGELYAGGDGLACGYLRQPQLTAERFVPDPFSHQPGARLYRTGDLVRWRPDGTLEFLGRLDAQVKILGHRVELEEIEAALAAHPGVAACAVVVRGSNDLDKELAAYVVPRGGFAPTIGPIRQWLGEKLPDYMIPSRWQTVGSLPLTPNGKINRKALAEFGREEVASGAVFAAPFSGLEHELVEIWRKALYRELVGVKDNFFDLGGNSLQAMSVCAQIGRRLGIELPLSWVFDFPTIESLAARMLANGANLAPAAPLEPADRRAPLPASFGQQQLWLQHAMLEDPATYNVPIAFRLLGQVDRHRVRGALRQVMCRHEILRTAVVQEKEILVQQIAEAETLELPWQEMNLAAMPSAGKETALNERLTSWNRQPFALAVAPLWRAMWISLGRDELVLAFNFHQSIIDEWSLRLFVRELERAYAAQGREAASLPHLAVQHADVSVWQRSRLAGPLLDRQREFWRRQLEDLPPVLELPTDKPRPLKASESGAVYRFHLGGRVGPDLCELARLENTTPFVVMLAAFQVWLYRYTGQSDLIVGTPAANRERAELQELLGNFLNTVPIRAKIDGKSDFLGFLRQSRETVVKAFHNATLPFEQMAELGMRDRPVAQHLLFQVMFVWLEEGAPPLRLDQTRGTLVPAQTKTSKYDLTLTIQRDGDDADCQIEYATDLFTEDWVKRMAGHMVELFRSIAENPQLPIKSLNLLAEPERRMVQEGWNRTTGEYPREKCIHHFFEEQAARMPQTVAVADGDTSLNYGELNLRASQLASHLRTNGVGPEDLVGLWVERTADMVVAMLAIVKAGAAYVPLDASMPALRLHEVLEIAKVKLLLTHSRLAGRLETASVRMLLLDQFREDSGKPLFSEEVGPRNLCYVVFTAGSSGPPRGVQIEHRSVVNLASWHKSAYDLGRGDRVSQLANLSFDAAAWEIWPALAAGASIFIVDEGTRMNSKKLVAWLATHKISVCFMPTSLAFSALQEEWPAHGRLRHLLTGGDWLTTRPDNRLKFQVVNHFGPTEATVLATSRVVAPANSGGDELPSIGRAIANVTVYVLDENLNLLPPGLHGELCIGGDGLARGYLRDPEATQEKFIDNPFSREPGAKLFKTGHLARWRTDGEVELLGHRNQQIKLPGARIDLGEIEKALCGLPNVREAAAAMHDDAAGSRCLAAYLVSDTSQPEDDLALRGHLSEKLPEHMLPASFIWLEKLPLTAEGKVDRKALPAPEFSLSGVGPASRPHSLLEWELIRIWRELFHREDIGRQDNFFALGGHSLLAARLVARIDKLLGCKIPVAALFQSPTVELLARRFANERWSLTWSSLVPLQPQGAKPPLFFVHGVGGDVFGFVELAAMLGPDQPCFGIQAVGLDGKSPRHASVEEMAAHYVREIVSFQTEGPFYLAGYSLGGIIAYEIAQQLYRRGRRVAMLAMLDSGPVGATPWFYYSVAMARHMTRRCLLHCAQWIKLPFKEKASYIKGRIKAIQNLVLENYFLNKGVGRVVPSMDAQPSLKPVAIDYFHSAALPYKLAAYPGQIDLFLSDQTILDWRWIGWRWFWEDLARGGAKFHRATGQHGEILSSANMPKLANALANLLQRRQAEQK